MSRQHVARNHGGGFASCTCGWEYDGKAWGEESQNIEAGRAVTSHMRYAHTERPPVTRANSETVASSDGWTGD